MLTIVFWRDKDMSGDVAVRPDGKISLPLLNDVQAAGLTPEQLRAADHRRRRRSSSRIRPSPSSSRQINSRKVFITGQVASRARIR